MSVAELRLEVDSVVSGVVAKLFVLISSRVSALFWIVDERILQSCVFFFFSSRRRHTRLQGDWSSDVCSSDLPRRRESRRSPPPSCRRRRAGAAGSRRSSPGTYPIGRQSSGPGCHASRAPLSRSEERRVGKECRSRWSPYH